VRERQGLRGLTPQAHQPDRSAIGTATDHSCFSSIGNVRQTQIAGKSSTILQTDPGLVSPVVKRDVERSPVKVGTPRKCGRSSYFRNVPREDIAFHTSMAFTPYIDCSMIISVTPIQYYHPNNAYAALTSYMWDLLIDFMQHHSCSGSSEASHATQGDG
jgi:hypothetical protein